MTSKLVVNTIEADTGISSVSFASSISMDSTSKFHFSAAGIDIGADTNINRPAAGVLGFNINDGEKVRIKSDGKVGIGTNLSSSTYKLEVWDDSAATFMIRKGNTSRIVLSNDSTSNTLYSQTISGYAARDFSVRIGQSEAIRINSSGNIGIATDISGVGGAYGR
ncbi:MAG: hypothetical protein VXY93_18525, partial [Pseudomonadota bacterium]|nr:hypothetical protein [Pseudomonadota bacterium]